jgi:hypothetical protein
MFASRVANSAKCSYRWLQKSEGLTFPATRFSELAAGKVPKLNSGLSRIEHRFLQMRSDETGNRRKVLQTR